MTVLSDRSLKALYPAYHGNTQPASIDLHIGADLLVWPTTERRDPRTDQSDLWRPVLTRDLDGPVWVLRPHLRYLATTREHIRIPDDCAGQIGARSSWGRDGLAVIQGPAGWLDPGYIGRPTLELSVVGSELVLWPGAAICQLIVFRLDRPSERPYGSVGRASKYQGDFAPTPSKSYREAQP